MPETVFFVDKEPGAAQLWGNSPHCHIYPALEFVAFSSIEETVDLIAKLRPTNVVIAPVLGFTRGMEIYHILRDEHNRFPGRIHINTPPGVKGNIRCNPSELAQILDRCVRIRCDVKLKEAEIEENGWVYCPNFYKFGTCKQWLNVN